MARREMGKTHLPRPRRPQRADPAARRAEGRRATSTSATSSGVTGQPAEVAARRAVARSVIELELLAKIRAPLPDTFHGLTDVEQRYRQAPTSTCSSTRRPGADFLTRAVAWSRAIRALSRRATASSRSRRRSCSRATAAPSREPFVTHYNELDRGLLPADRDRALPEAADRRRARARLRDRQGLPQRGRLATSTTPSSRCSSGTRRTRTTATRWPGSRGSSRRSRSRLWVRRRSTFRGQRDRPDSAVAAACASSTSLAEHDLWIRDERSCARALDARERRHDAATEDWAQLVDHAFSHFVEPTLDQPTIVHDYPVELSPFARTTDDDPSAHRAVRVLRRRDGARQRVLRDQRLRGAGRRASRSQSELGRRRAGAILTTSRRSRTACRRPAGSASGSTGWRCC